MLLKDVTLLPVSMVAKKTAWNMGPVDISDNDLTLQWWMHNKAILLRGRVSVNLSMILILFCNYIKFSFD